MLDKRDSEQPGQKHSRRPLQGRHMLTSYPMHIMHGSTGIIETIPPMSFLQHVMEYDPQDYGISAWRSQRIERPENSLPPRLFVLFLARCYVPSAFATGLQHGRIGGAAPSLTRCGMHGTWDGDGWAAT